MDAREERLARNETVFREVNENIEQAAFGADEHVFDFICECSSARCNVLLPLTLRAYEEVRANPRAFLLASGHEVPEIETIIARQPGYVVVLKRGEAGEIARETDPRS